MYTLLAQTSLRLEDYVDISATNNLDNLIDNLSIMIINSKLFYFWQTDDEKNGIWRSVRQRFCDAMESQNPDLGK